MYHLSSSSPRNLFTTGDPTSALSHEFSKPKPNTNPLVLEEESEVDIGEESASFEKGVDGFVGSEFKLGSTVEFCSFSLSVVSVSGFMEHRVIREMALLLGLEFGRQRACTFGLVWGIGEVNVVGWVAILWVIGVAKKLTAFIVVAEAAASDAASMAAKEEEEEEELCDSGLGDVWAAETN